jgi:hypothetical protein
VIAAVLRFTSSYGALRRCYTCFTKIFEMLITSQNGLDAKYNETSPGKARGLLHASCYQLRLGQRLERQVEGSSGDGRESLDA